MVRKSKITAVAVTAVLLCAFALPCFAGVFTTFDSYSSFTMNGNPVYNAGDTPGDYWVGGWEDSTTSADSLCSIADGKGWKGTKALALGENGSENQGCYLFVTASNGISKDQTGAKYLRVWMDLTGIGFRKANFGVCDSANNLYTTDEENSVAVDWPFYYLPDGASDWQTMYHGGDGCFGDAQDSDVYGLKGWFAFPVSDFVIRENANPSGFDADTPAPMNDVAGVYMFWDYSENYDLGAGQLFYLDNIEFVPDYTAFNSALYAETTAATETAAPAAAAADTAAAETAAAAPAAAAATTTAAQTYDSAAVAVLAAVSCIALAAIVVGKKNH